jgi:hypothetical protein
MDTQVRRTPPEVIFQNFKFIPCHGSEKQWIKWLMRGFLTGEKIIDGENKSFRQWAQFHMSKAVVLSESQKGNGEYYRCVNRTLCSFPRVKLVETPMPLTARSKACVCGRLLAGIVGLNPAGGMHVGLLWMLCVVWLRSLCRADQSSRGVLPNVVGLNVILNPQPWWNIGALVAVEHEKKLLFKFHILSSASYLVTPCPLWPQWFTVIHHIHCICTSYLAFF